MNRKKVIIGTTAIVVLAIIAFAGCESAPRWEPIGEPRPAIGPVAVMPGDQPVIVNPTATDIARTTADAVAVIEPAVERGEVTSDDVEAFSDAAGPILNPLTGGWFSAGVLLLGGLLKHRESKRRGEVLQAIDQAEGTPGVVEQLQKLRPDLAGDAVKAVRR